MLASYCFRQSFLFCFSHVHFNHCPVFGNLLLSEEVKNGAFPQASLYMIPQDPAVWLRNRKLPWLSLVSEVRNFLGTRNARSTYAPLNLLGQYVVRMGISVYPNGSSHVDY